MENEVVVDGSAEGTNAGEQSTAEVQRGYDNVANPEKVREEAALEEKATETPPENQELVELRAKVERIPDVLKQLNDVNGRYGRLTQRFEELQARLATPATTQRAANETAVDVEELLKEVKESFGEDELYQGLKSAFSRLPLGKSVDQESVGSLVKEVIAAERKAEFDSALSQVTERHPDFFEVKASPEFKAWTETLSVRERAILNRSEDPDYINAVFDEFKSWKSTEAGKESAKVDEKPAPQQKSKSRLEAAVLPTDGTKPPQKGELNPKDSIRAGYERVAGARLR